MYLGAFADVFGVRPWEWDNLTVSEARALAHYIDEQNKGGE